MCRIFSTPFETFPTFPCETNVIHMEYVESSLKSFYLFLPFSPPYPLSFYPLFIPLSLFIFSSFHFPLVLSFLFIIFFIVVLSLSIPPFVLSFSPLSFLYSFLCDSRVYPSCLYVERRASMSGLIRSPARVTPRSVSFVQGSACVLYKKNTAMDSVHKPYTSFLERALRGGRLTDAYKTERKSLSSRHLSTAV